MVYRIKGDVLVSRNLDVSGSAAISGSVTAVDGSADAPAYSFINNPDTGLYSTGNSLNWSIGGTREMFLLSNALLPGVDAGLALGLSTVGWTTIYGRQSGGTVGGPTFTWASDTDTGLYKPDVDVMGISAGGTEIARFANTASNPQILSHIGSAGAPGYSFEQYPGTGFRGGVNFMEWSINGSGRANMGHTYLRPVSDGAMSLGLSTVGWSRFYANQTLGTTPNFTWAGDIDTGFFHPSADIVGVTAGGNTVVTFDGNGTAQALFGNGGFGNPSISFSGSQNTGFYQSGGSITIANAGSDNWAFQSTGNFDNFGSGVIKNSDGDVADPAYSFDSDTDLGLYRITTNTLGFAANGLKAQVDTTGLKTGPNGSAASPSIAFVLDTNTGIFRPTDGWDGTGVGISVQGDEVARFENDAAFDDGNLQVTKDLVVAGDVEQVWQVTSGSGAFVDETTDATSLAQGDYQIFRASEAVGDYAAYGMSSPFNLLSFDNTGGTAGTGQTTIAWEYWNGSDWASLTLIVDGTNGFKTSPGDNQTVFWHIPIDWQPNTLNSVEKYYVRARLSGFEVYTTNPVYDIVRVGAYQRGITLNVSDTIVIPSSSINVLDGIGVKVSGTLTEGVLQGRWFYADFNNVPFFTVQSTNSGTGVRVSEGNSDAVSFGFLDSDGIPDDGLGIYGSTSNERLSIAASDTEVARFDLNSAQFLDGSEGTPSVSFINESDVGIYRPTNNQLGLAANNESVIVDNDATVPSFRPDADDTWALGEASLRWADVYAVQTTVGDLVMHDPDEGEASPFLILREGHETLEVYDVQANKKFIVPLQEVELTPADQERINKARAKFYKEEK